MSGTGNGASTQVRRRRARVLLSERFGQISPGRWWRSAPAGIHAESGWAGIGDLHAAATWASSQAGQWASVLQIPGATLLAVDPARSIPLFYAHDGWNWLVADRPEPLLAALPDAAMDWDGAFQLRHAGYVLGSRTLVDGMAQVEAGCVVELRDGHNQPHVHRYRRWHYAPGQEQITDAGQFEHLVLGALRQAVGRVVDGARGRQLAVPLSGGIDSRLLLALLVEAGAQRVVTFTYGVAGSPEARVSERVAGSLAVPWHGVPMDPKAVHLAWHKHGGSFIRDAWAGASLPHYQDWYALGVLTATGVLEPDAIVLPGHTVVGNLHDWHLLDEPAVNARQFARVLAAHHLNLQGQANMALTHRAVVRQVRDFLADVGFHEGARCPEDLRSWIEDFNLRERQAKYINNSVRAYEHAGVDWAMPMLDVAVSEAWSRGAYCLTDGPRTWYRDMASRYYASVAGMVRPAQAASPRQAARSAGATAWATPGIAQHAGKSGRGAIAGRDGAAAADSYWTTWIGGLPGPVKDIVVGALDAAHLAEPIRRILSARTQLRHPMAFEAFLDRGARAYLPRVLAGGSIQGVFTDLFLAGTWAPGGDVLEGLRRE